MSKTMSIGQQIWEAELRLHPDYKLAQEITAEIEAKKLELIQLEKRLDSLGDARHIASFDMFKASNEAWLAETAGASWLSK